VDHSSIVHCAPLSDFSLAAIASSQRLAAAAHSKTTIFGIATISNLPNLATTVRSNSLKFSIAAFAS